MLFRTFVKLSTSWKTHTSRLFIMNKFIIYYLCGNLKVIFHHLLALIDPTLRPLSYHFPKMPQTHNMSHKKREKTHRCFNNYNQIKTTFPKIVFEQNQAQLKTAIITHVKIFSVISMTKYQPSGS